MSARAVDRVGPVVPPPAGEPDAVWELDAVGADWRPAPGEDDLPVARGRLELHREGLVFRAADVIDRATGEPVVSVIPAEGIVDANPLAPSSPLTNARDAGTWMSGPLQRQRCPGFVVSTSVGAWAFDGPKGVRRADAIRRRYARTARGGPRT